MSIKESNTAKRSLVPTLGLGFGMLVGGLIAAIAGAMLGSEVAVVTLYAGGTIAGAITGSILGFRCLSRRQGQD